MSYLSVATGDVDEIKGIIPDMTEYILNIRDIEEDSDSEKLPSKFIENEIGGYFIIAMGKTFTIWCFSAFLVLPTLYVLHKVCKKVKLWEDLMSAFFFNTPLRTVTEMYIDLALQIIVNTKLLKFKNYS